VANARPGESVSSRRIFGAGFPVAGFVPVRLLICGTAAADSWLGMRLWRGRWSAASWREYLEAGESRATLAAIRHNTHTGRPIGSADFMREVEGQTKRRLALQKRGPKREAEPGKSQGTFSFGG
jgi:hypothetical protein